MWIFEKWVYDPNGWYRHIIVGAIVLAIGVLTKKINLFFVITIILACLKETYDTYYGMGSFIFDNASKDVIATVLPYLTYYLFIHWEVVELADMPSGLEGEDQNDKAQA